MRSKMHYLLFSVFAVIFLIALAWHSGPFWPIKRSATCGTINQLETEIFAYYRMHGVLPKVLPSKTRTNDAWGNPIKYITNSYGFSLISFGSDEKFGGTDGAHDIIFNGFIRLP